MAQQNNLMQADGTKYKRQAILSRLLIALCVLILIGALAGGAVWAYFYFRPSTFEVTIDVDTETSPFVRGGGTYERDEEVTLVALDRLGYEFSGWEHNGRIVSTEPVYTFTVNASTAGKYSAKYTQLGYTITFYGPDGEVLYIQRSVQQGEMPNYQGPIPQKQSTDLYRYVFENKWAPTLAPATADASYYAQFTTIGREYSVYVNYGNNSSYRFTRRYGEAVGVLSIPRAPEGMEFVGWFSQPNGEGQRITNTTVVTGDMTVYAHYATKSYTITLYLNGGKYTDGAVPNGGVYNEDLDAAVLSYNSNSSFELTAPTTYSGDESATFRGWGEATQQYPHGDVQHLQSTVTISGTTGNKEYYAYWEVEDTQLQDTKVQRVDRYGNPNEEGKYVLFGYYPQSSVSTSAADVGFIVNQKGWLRDNTLKSVWYVPGSSESEYYKVEPILWRIITTENGNPMMLLSDKILAYERYADSSSTTYENSEIRHWLNNDFLNAAFSDTQQAMIATTDVDNGDENMTQDKIFLLSWQEYQDIRNGVYDGVNQDILFSRSYTNYAKPLGNNNVEWMLRSNDTYIERYDCIYYTNSSVNKGEEFKSTASGIMPALWVCTEDTLTLTINLNGGKYDGSTYHTNSDKNSITIPVNYEQGLTVSDIVPTHDAVSGKNVEFTGFAPRINGKASDFTSRTQDIVIPANKLTHLVYDAYYNINDDENFISYKRVDAEGNEAVDGDYMLFGYYPSSLVVKPDGSAVTAEDLGITNEFIYGNNVGLYGTNTSNYGGENVHYFIHMPYQHIHSTFNNDTYTNGILIDDERFSTTGYYFAVTPMRWRILKTNEDGSLLLFNGKIINAMNFQTLHKSGDSSVDFYSMYGYYENNYEHSVVRAWLNGEFYNSAFTADQQKLIQQTKVDNSASTTSSTSSNQYCCKDTDDNIFLLSYQDMLNTEYGFSSDTEYDDFRTRLVTDYATINGVSSHGYGGHFFEGNYWLRSPSYNYDNQACYMSGGNVREQNVSYTSIGIVPALIFRPDKAIVTVYLNGGVKNDAPANAVEVPDKNALIFTFDQNIDADGRQISFTPTHASIYDNQVTFTGFTLRKNKTVGDYSQATSQIQISAGGGYFYYDAWYSMESSRYTSTYKRINADDTEQIDGDYIQFGYYPQTVKSTETVVTDIDFIKISNLPLNGFNQLAIDSDNYVYVKQTAKPIPYGSHYTFEDGTSITSGTEYYFKFEPIIWKILKTNDDGSILLFSENIINAMAYQTDENWNSLSDVEGPYKSNYEKSLVRAWLNGEFYNSAFTADQQKLIQQTTVDNSASTTSNTSSYQYCCKDTDDNIFLLSYQDMLNIEYGFPEDNIYSGDSRTKAVVDYALANGAYESDRKYNNHYTSYYWLRSPYYDYVSAVNSEGFLDSQRFDSTNYGVVPALTFKLPE